LRGKEMGEVYDFSLPDRLIAENSQAAH
jgi:hypothetical protein